MATYTEPMPRAIVRAIFFLMLSFNLARTTAGYTARYRSTKAEKAVSCVVSFKAEPQSKLTRCRREEKQKRLTAGAYSIVDQNPRIPALALHTKVPLRPGRLALGEEDDDAAQEDKVAEAGHGP